MASPVEKEFLRPSAIERALNRVVGILVGLGIGLGHNYLLQVRGRKTGRMYSTPVNLLEVSGKQYLVCPRGRAQWVRNAEADGWVWLKKRDTQKFAIRAVTDEQKPEILRQYLDQFKTTVQPYFPVKAGSPTAAFVPYVARYAVFEIQRTDERR